jgi:hypothetical protein
MFGQEPGFKERITFETGRRLTNVRRVARLTSAASLIGLRKRGRWS